MNRKILILPLLLLAMLANADPIVRFVSTDGSTQPFAANDVRKIALNPTTVDVLSSQGSVLLSIPLAEFACVEFAESTPETPTAIDATLVPNSETAKIIENGQVYILSSGRKYTIMGVEVESKE